MRKPHAFSFARPLAGPLTPPDWERWSRLYPGGLGDSAFSAPAWQRLMLAEEGDRWRLRWLRARAPGTALSLPVQVRRLPSGRWLSATRPVAYYVSPVERALLEQEDLDAVLRAARSPALASFTLWLAPWSRAAAAAGFRGLGRLDVSQVDTFLIRLEQGAAAHLRNRVNATRRRRLARSQSAGLELLASPTPAQRDAYYGLYRCAHAAGGWTGPPFSRAFFEGAATTLGRGGELCVASRGGRVVGGGVLLYDRHAVHYFQGAIDRTARDVAPHDALYARALVEAERRGLAYVNLGGVNRGNRGLAQFKRSWGARPAAVRALQWRSGPRVLARRWRAGGSPE